MTMKTSWFMQSFAPNRGQLKPGERFITSSAAGATKEGRGMVDPRKRGLSVIEAIADIKTGEATAAKVLSQHGQVPENLADQIKGS